MQVGLVTHLVVELNLLETGRKEKLFLVPLNGKEFVLTLGILKARSSNGGSRETWGGIESS